MAAFQVCEKLLVRFSRDKPRGLVTLAQRASQRLMSELGALFRRPQVLSKNHDKMSNSQTPPDTSQSILPGLWFSCFLFFKKTSKFFMCVGVLTACMSVHRVCLVHVEGPGLRDGYGLRVDAGSRTGFSGRTGSATNLWTISPATFSSLVHVHLLPSNSIPVNTVLFSPLSKIFLLLFLKWRRITWCFYVVWHKEIGLM